MHLRPQEAFFQLLWHSHTPVAGICAIDLCDAEGEEGKYNIGISIVTEDFMR